MAKPRRDYRADAVCRVARYGDLVAGAVACTGRVGSDGETLALRDAHEAKLQRVDGGVHPMLDDDNRASVVPIG